MKKVITKNLKEFYSSVEYLFSNLDKKDSAFIVTLSGNLGSGKTTFVQYIASLFGIKENITSPTFVIQKEYKISNNPLFKKMIHIDAYRLEDKSELEYLGWNEIIKNSENIIFIEWPEKVEGIYFPNDTININLNILDGEMREIIFK